MLPPRRRRFAAYTVLVGAALVLACVIAEIVLTVAPIPGITYHTFYYDDVTGQRFYPHTTMIYRNERGDHVRRRVNDWGYLDADHGLFKMAGAIRIGFFGDSFTEARQVPLAQTFHGRLEAELNRPTASSQYECIAISMMGYGTLQSWLECRRWMETLDLDHVVYVFCENDPGNNVPALNFSDDVPYPVLVGDSLAIDRSFAERNAHKARWKHRTWQYLKSNSLLFSTIETRVRFLQSRGIDLRVDEAERHMAAPAGRNAPIAAISPPSTWPDSLRDHAALLTERVIVEWKREVEASGRTFVIAYVPRTAAVKTPQLPADDWHAWLRDVCARNQVSMIDPTERLVALQASGRDVFFDHFTDAGHEAFAAELLAWFREGLAPTQSAHP
ncbi:MAG: hypothetical protein L0Z51_00575 [Candidatus Latescibacteria bacterium]|nr:hypothetical protein [Candidatus Latescibacterota bacterium]